MSMAYSDFVTRLVTNMAGITITNASAQNPTSDTDFNNFLPEIIDYAEQRIYRELDFLATRTTDTTQSTTAGSRDVPIPSQFIVIEQFTLLLPPNKSRVVHIRASTQAIDMLYPDSSITAAPVQGVNLFALYDQQEATSHVRIAPTPDGQYTAEFRGTFRPAPMSYTNTTTFLGTYLPDLFFCAAMIHASDYMRNGMSGDTPGMSQEWEGQYDKLKMSAAVEELRKKSIRPQPPQPMTQAA